MSIKDLCYKIYSNYPLLHKAMDGEYFVKVIDIVLTGRTSNGLNEDNQTPLILVNRIDMVKFLVNQGADVNVIDSFGRSAIMLITDPFIVKLLINSGADIDTIDLDKYSIFDHTFDDQITGVFKLYVMIESGAKNNTKHKQLIIETPEKINNYSAYIAEFYELWKGISINYKLNIDYKIRN